MVRELLLNHAARFHVVFNILTAICTEVNHCVVSIHDYLTVLQTIGKVVKVYQKNKRPKDASSASLGYSDSGTICSLATGPVFNRCDFTLFNGCDFYF